MASRKSQQRTIRATKNQVAAQLQSILPGLTGSQILAVTKGPDATYWQATISSGFGAFGQVEQSIDTYVEFDSQFFVTNLLSAVDPSITAAMIENITVSASDSTKIETLLKRTVVIG